MSLSKNINPSLVLVQPRKTHPFIIERLLIGHKESNQTNSMMHKVQMHAGAISKLLYGFASLLAIIYILKLVDYLLRQTHKPYNNFCSLHLLSDIPMFYIRYLTMHKVHMHAGAMKQLLYGCGCKVTEPSITSQRGRNHTVSL